MAKATATCKCEKCGKEFVKVKICGNRKEADSFEEWAKENCTECPDCYAERVKAERDNKADELIKEFGWAEIEGVSEKQIAYAKSLRNKYITVNADNIRKAEEAIASTPIEEVEAFAKQNGTTVEETVKSGYIYCGVEKAYSLKSEKSARAIIDLLR